MPLEIPLAFALAFVLSCCAFTATAYAERPEMVPRLPRMPQLPRVRRPALPRISTKRVGGLRFVKVGRLTVSWCIARSAEPLR